MDAFENWYLSWKDMYEKNEAVTATALWVSQGGDGTKQWKVHPNKGNREFSVLNDFVLRDHLTWNAFDRNRITLNRVFC